MGMGWKNVSGGVYSTGKCRKCHKGEVIICVSDYEESEYPPFERNDEYTGRSTCGCEDFSKMSQEELKYYNKLF